MAEHPAPKGSGATAGFDNPAPSKGGSSQTGTSVLTGKSKTMGIPASGATSKTNKHGPDLVAGWNPQGGGK